MHHAQQVWGLATRNPHKIREIKGILQQWHSVHICTWEEVAYTHPADTHLILILPPKTLQLHEPYATYHENSLAKACAFHQWILTQDSPPIPILAEDSGLEVDALHGLPGPYSAVWGHPSWTAQQRILFLLDCLKGQNLRTARFRTVLTALFTPNEYLFFEGILPGHICKSPRGTQGFGYDPIFIPTGKQQTLAELPEKTKNQISHRAQALYSWMEWLGWVK